MIDPAPRHERSEDDVHLLTPYLASLIDDERRADAARQAIARRAAAADRRPHRSPFRHGLAIGLAAVSRISAGAVRRLDACLADDLARALGSSDAA